MTRFLKNHFPSHIYNKNLIYILFTLIICMILFYFIKLFYSNIIYKQEGFEQSKPYILKENQDIYDDFYSEVYDIIHRNKECNLEDIMFILKNTKTNSSSLFLDVGCKTGSFIQELYSLNLNGIGIDSSKPIINIASQKNMIKDHLYLKNMLDPMSFKPNTFSHVYCTFNSFYSLQKNEKRIVLKNIFHWLKPNGYLCIQLLNPEKVTFLTSHPLYSERVDAVDFPEFKYQITHTKRKHNEHTVNEKIQDYNTGYIRENEMHYWIEPIPITLEQIEKEGFLEKIHVKKRDDCFLYIFTKNR